VRSALRDGKIENPKVASRLALYTLSKELHISPMEVYDMPFSLVQELLIVHEEIESFKSETMDKTMSKIK